MGNLTAIGKPAASGTFLFDLPLTHFLLTALTEASDVLSAAS